MALPPVFLQAAARTPFAPLGGALRRLPAVDMAAQAARAFLDRPGMPAIQPGALVLAQAVPAGCGPDPARAVAMAAGIPEARALSIRAGRASGLEALLQAEALVHSGAVDSVLVVGVESASGAPFLLPAARWGSRFGEVELLDALLSEGPRPEACATLPCEAGHLPLPELSLTVPAGRRGTRRIEADETAGPLEGRAIPAGDGAAACLLVRRPSPGARACLQGSAWIPPGPHFQDRLRGHLADLASDPIPWVASPGLPALSAPRWVSRLPGAPGPWGAEGICALLTLLDHLERRGGLALGSPEEGVHLLVLEACPC